MLATAVWNSVLDEPSSILHATVALMSKSLLHLDVKWLYNVLYVSFVIWRGLSREVKKML